MSGDSNKMQKFVNEMFSEYLSQGDWRVKENSNTIYSFGALNKYVMGKTTALFWEGIYNEIDPEIIEGHRNGDYHIHDLSSYSSYCFGASLRDLLLKGVTGVQNVSRSSPAKRLRSISSQIANIATIFQNEVAGAIAFSSFNVYLAPFLYFDKIRRDGICDNGKKIDLEYNSVDLEDATQSIQNMIYALNSNSRLGSEPVFSNLTLDFKILSPMQNLCVIVGGQEQKNYTYKEFQKESDIILNIFATEMLKGDCDGRPFAYPIPTFNIGKNMEWDKYDIVFELAAKTGTPYFGNFMQSTLKEDDVYSMCPLHEDTLVEIKTFEDKNLTLPIKTIHDSFDLVRVLTLDGWCFAKPNKMPKTVCYEIYIEGMNGEISSVVMGENHLQPTIHETKCANELVVGDLIPVFNNKYYPILGISRVNLEDDQDLYCFEVYNDSHLFLLANGIYTHNCRLRLDKRELINKTGGLFGAAEKTGCYSEDTEVLTTRGWKFFKDVSFEDNIYTLTQSREIEIHNPEQIFEYDYEGEMVHFQGSSMDFLVTPNHNMAYIPENDKNTILFKKAEDCTGSEEFPLKSNWNGGTDCDFFTIPNISSPSQIPMEVWLSFLGLFISEGSISESKEIVISQKKDHNKSIIEEVLNNMGLKYRIETNSENSNNYCISNKPLWDLLRSQGFSTQKYIPEYIWDLPKKYLDILYNYLIIGDECIPTTTKGDTYHTTSKKLADDIQHLMMLLGYGSTLHTKLPRLSDIKDRNMQYEITRKACNNIGVKNIKPPSEYYKGKVYCLQVPNHTLFVRRNGHVMWCGNSLGVFTVNLPAIGYRNKGKPIQNVIDDIKKQMNIGKTQLLKKKEIIQKEFDNGLYPALSVYLETLNTLFLTIGFVGGHEFCLNYLGKGIETNEGRDFIIETIHIMRNELSKFQEETGLLFNLEYTPAESTCFRLALKDKKRYPDIIQAGRDEHPYYTNSTHLPVGIDWPLSKILNHQNGLLSLATGGSVYHCNIDQNLNKDLVKRFIKTTFTNYDAPYISISPLLKMCPDCGMKENIGSNICPDCGKIMEQFQRITGYIRPISSYNDGKASEFLERYQNKITEEDL